MSKCVFHSGSATKLTSAVKINGKAKGTFFVCLARKSTALNYRLVSRVQVAFVWGIILIITYGPPQASPAN